VAPAAAAADRFDNLDVVRALSTHAFAWRVNHALIEVD